MDKIRGFVESLDEAEKQKLLLELLIPVIENMDGERCVTVESDRIVGYVMSRDHRMQLLPADLVDRLPHIDRTNSRPVSEIMTDLKARLAQEV